MPKKKTLTVTAELSPLETSVMEILWTKGTATADEVRRALSDPLTDSSVRTILRRLEAKKYVAHDREGKTFIFRPAIARRGAAAAAALRIIRTICGGAADSLMLGMLESNIISPKELDEIRARIARGEVDDD
jgi:predicted transcriptional regulator